MVGDKGGAAGESSDVLGGDDESLTCLKYACGLKDQLHTWRIRRDVLCDRRRRGQAGLGWQGRN